MALSCTVLVDAASPLRGRAFVQTACAEARINRCDIKRVVETECATLNQACAIFLGARTQDGALTIPMVERMRAADSPHRHLCD